MLHCLLPAQLHYFVYGFAMVCGMERRGIIYFLECIILLSAGLAVFNLFPIPPLDGSKVLFAVLPDRWYIMLMRYERYGMFLLAVLLLTNVLDVPLLFLRGKLLDLLTWITEPLFYFIANRLI